MTAPDPFANLGSTAAEGNVAVADAVDDVAFFLSEMTIGEAEFEQPVARANYRMPEDGSWVPVTILTAKKNVRSMNVLIPDGEGGDKPAKVDIDQFELECQHASTAYGDKPRPYLMFVPVFDLKLPKTGGTWTKTSGRKLLAATAITEPGQKITPDILDELAQKMVGKTVMAQVRYSKPKTYNDITPRKTADGEGFVKAQVDEDEEYVFVIKDVNGNLVMKNSSDAWPYGEDKLIRANLTDDTVFLIPDPNGRIVKDTVTTTKIFDNLQDDVAPVPGTVTEKKLPGGGVSRIPTGDRRIEIHREDDSEVWAAVTWETVGQMVTKGRKIGTKVTAVADTTGEEVVASWNGTAWVEASEDEKKDTFSG